MKKDVDISDILDGQAELGQRWLRIAICGPSNGGKTYSALRLGTGMAKITGGDIRLVDTQNRQSADYADQFKFRLVNFPPPFAPLRFLATFQRSAHSGSKVIIVDSMSDEHEGEGGVNDEQEEALERMWKAACVKAAAKGWQEPNPDTFNQLAWKEAKRPRRQMILGLPRVEAHIIFLFRAKKQSAAFAEKPRPGTPKPNSADDGWKPIAGDKFFWDMPLRMMLLPMSGGVPTWQPVAECEKTYIRRPSQFDPILRRFDGKPLCEQVGEDLARWAQGSVGGSGRAPDVGPPNEWERMGGKQIFDALTARINEATTHDELDGVAADLAKVPPKKLRDETRAGLGAALEAKRETLAESA